MIEEDLIKCYTVDRGDFTEYWQNNVLIHCSFNDGWKIWFEGFNGTLHRENGPAVIKPDGSCFYYLNGKIHRENGPAIIRADGSEEYWYNGVKKQ